jgi:hypothetical protein
MPGLKILPAVQVQRDEVAHRLAFILETPVGTELHRDALDTIRSLQAEIRSLRAKKHARSWLGTARECAAHGDAVGARRCIESALEGPDFGPVEDPRAAAAAAAALPLDDRRPAA